MHFELPYTATELINKIETYPFITPEMFGAKGDGKTDDTEAFKKAIDSVSAIPGDVHSLIDTQYRPGSNFGKTILLGNKTYYLKDGLVIDKFGVTIIGCGAAVRDVEGLTVGTTIIAGENAECVVKISACKVTLKNIIVKGSKTGFHTTYQEVVFSDKSSYVPMATSILLENCHFYGTGASVLSDATGFYISAPVFVRLVSCTATKCNKGFWAEICKGMNGTTLELTQCWARQVGYSGFHLDHCYYCTLNNCACDISNQYSYVLEYCYSVTLISCGGEFLGCLCAVGHSESIVLISPFAAAIGQTAIDMRHESAGDTLCDNIATDKPASLLKVLDSKNTVIIGGSTMYDPKDKKVSTEDDSSITIIGNLTHN